MDGGVQNYINIRYANSPQTQLRYNMACATLANVSRRRDISRHVSSRASMHDYMAWRQRPLKKAGKYPPGQTLDTSK